MEIMEASQSSENDHKMPWPAYAEVFQLQPKLGNEKNWAFLCKICFGRKIIHASRTSTANLRKRLNIFRYTKHSTLAQICTKHKAKHSHLLENIDKAKLKLSNKRSSEDPPNNIPNKHQTLERWGPQ